MNRSRPESSASAVPSAVLGDVRRSEPDLAPGVSGDSIGHALSRHAEDGPRERAAASDPSDWGTELPEPRARSSKSRTLEWLGRSAVWFQATPAELLGLGVLLLGACAVTAVVLWDAGSRPTELPSAAVGVGPGIDGHGSGHAPAGASSDQDLGDDDAITHAGGPSDSGGAGTGVDDDADPAGPDTEANTEVTVYVSGAVSDSRVVVLRAGARVGDALAAAGGPKGDADLARLNLARPLVDGEQVHVPLIGEDVPLPEQGPPPGVAPGGAAAGTDAQGRIDLNHADQAGLETLPGIGPAKAAAIIAHREEHGPFAVPGDLRAVPGIGERTFQQLADLISVG